MDWREGEGEEGKARGGVEGRGGAVADTGGWGIHPPPDQEKIFAPRLLQRRSLRKKCFA
jgi:hypothetical protein